MLSVSINIFFVKDDEGGIAHAQLTLGHGMIMLGSVRDDEFEALQSTPQKMSGTTQSPYIVVKNFDNTFEKAQKAGAKITIEPKDTDYGGRYFSCLDPEGHLWNFGSYDPWQ